MKLTKAIEILQLDIDDPGSIAIEDVNEAEQLGIEALKFALEVRANTSEYIDFELPGETKH